VFQRIKKEVIERFSYLSEKYFFQGKNENFSDDEEISIENFIFEIENFSEGFKLEELEIPYTIIFMSYSCGFDTRVAVRKMLNYLKSNLQEEKIFIEESNKFVEQIKNFLTEKNSPIENLKQIREVNFDYRKLMKNFGVKAGVEIEPEIATFLINFFLEKNENLIYGICPGAGGFDDIAFLVMDDKKNEILEELRKVEIDFEKFCDDEISVEFR